MINKPQKYFKKINKLIPPFIYQPLTPRHIRLFQLLPGDFNSSIAIILYECDLGKAKFAYEALSYVWGDPTRKISIECNGAELLITKNLQIALRRIRFLQKPRTLWVDAICINQDDLVEREQQVPYMREIYPKADKVLVWLGEADEKAELALKAIDEWANFNRQYRHSNDATRFAKFEERFASKQDYRKLEELSTFKPEYRDTLKAVGELTYRAWFNRCWTFQEILLSTKAILLVGESGLTWEQFYHALEVFPLHLLADDVLNFNALVMCHGKAKIGNNGLFSSDSIPVSRNLSRLLQITRNFTASDPRDKIYSLLSVAQVKNPDKFLPNYSVSIRKTFIYLTLDMIRDESSLNVLMSNGELDRDKNLPSWCPDLRCKRGVVLTGYYDYISYNVNSGLRTDLSNLRTNERFELELEGALIDVVTEVFDLEELAQELKASLIDINFTAVLSEFSRKISLDRLELDKDMSLEASLLRTLSADHWFFGSYLKNSYREQWFPTHLRFRDLKRNIGPSDRSAGSTVKMKGYQLHSLPRITTTLNLHRVSSLQNIKTTDVMFSTNVDILDPKIDSPFTHAVIDKVYRQSSPFYVKGQDFSDARNIDAPTLNAIAKEAISQALFYMKGKRLFITKHGYLGTSTSATRVGDELCCFWGADVPFVTRMWKKNPPNHEKRISRRDAQSDADLKWEIVGESYVNGIMYGELFRLLENGQKVQPLIDHIKLRKFIIV